MKNTLVHFLAGMGIVLLFPQWSGAQWVQTPMPPAGAQALAANGGNIFAGTSGSGVFLTTNNGTSWTAVNTGLTNRNVYALTVNGGNLFAGTNGGGVFLTTNNGTSWTAVNTGLTNLYVNGLSANGGNVFAGTNGGGVFLTTNNGTSWIRVSNGLTNGTILSLAVNGGNVFAGTNGGGVFLTTNNGTSWTPVNNGLSNLYVYSLMANGGNVFAGTNGGGVFLTTNNGTSWTAVNNGLTLTNVPILALMASGGNVFAGIASGGIFLTTNNGTNWIDFNTGLTGFPPVGAFVANGSYIFAGTGGPVFKRLLSDVGNLPVAPTLSSPANAATNVAHSPTMIWNAVTGATSYRLQVSTSSTFSTTIVNDSTLTGTSRATGPLAGATVYYWRVRAKNVIGAGAWSTVWSFTTIWSPPAAPVLVSPADSAIISALSVTFSWNASSGAASYTLNVSSMPDFSILTVNQSGITSKSQLISGLSNNTAYYWRVNAVNPAGTSSWSDTSSFTMAWDTTWRCIAHWSFDSSSGSTYYDVTGHGYDATATGTGVGIDSGVSGQALNCPDSGYDISAANSENNFNLTTFSIECWAYLNASPSQYPAEAKLFDYQNIAPSGGTRNGYTLYIDPSGHVAFTMSSSDGSAWEQATSSTIVAGKAWYFLTATYDSSYLRLYVNGVLDASLSYQGTYLAPGANARIGCQRRTNGIVSRFLNGRIDELKLYNYALPQDSINAHYISTAIKPTKELPALASNFLVRACNSLIHITLPSAMLGRVVDVAVYSTAGRELVRKNVRSASAQFTLPINGLSFGAYVLAVKDRNRISTARFVVVR
jgi:hypothetical protein